MGIYRLVISLFLLSSLCNDAAGAFIDNTCKPAEREALLQLKRNVEVSGSDFYSWVGTDCCRDWEGVSCDNRTGHVISLEVNLLVLKDHVQMAPTSQVFSSSCGQSRGGSGMALR